jgi:PBP1b-binding outer membrane lipoprotein LpoB
MRPRYALPALTLALITSGCTTTADPAEVQDLAQALTEETHALGIPETDTQAECRARLYLESDLSDEAIDAIRNGAPPAPKTEKDIETLRELADKIAEECL